jgi:hypothetical protein
MAFTVSKTPLVTAAGRESKPNPYLPVIGEAEKGVTYEDVMSEAEGKAAVTLLRRAAAHHNIGLAIKVSEPNGAGKVKVLFKTQDKKQRKPKDETVQAPASVAVAS